MRVAVRLDERHGLNDPLVLGNAIRVPTPDVSMAIMVMTLERETVL